MRKRSVGQMNSQDTKYNVWVRVDSYDDSPPVPLASGVDLEEAIDLVSKSKDRFFSFEIIEVVE